MCLLLVCALGIGEFTAPATALPARWIVLDVSSSCAGGRSQWRRWCERAVADLPPHGQVGLIRVGARAEISLPLGPPEAYRAALREALAAPLDGNASELGAGLTLAAQSTAGADVILITDAQPSDDLDAGARAISDRGGRLFGFAPPLPPPNGAWLEQVVAPARVSSGGRATLRLSVAAWSPTACVVEVVGLGPESEAVWQRWELVADAGGSLLACTTPPLTNPTDVEVRLTVKGADDPSDNRQRVRIGIDGAPSVWVVGSTLNLSGCDPRQLAPTALAAALSSPPDAVVLADVTVHELSSAAPALRRAVEGGTALVVLGAHRAFPQGGYAESDLEALLPLTSGPGTERGSPLNTAFVVDASGSMLGSGHYSDAVEALPWGALRADDPLLTVAFAEQPTPVSDWSPDHEAASTALRGYAQRAPGGGTDVGAALLNSLDRLGTRGEGQRVLIAITDSLDPNPGRHLPALNARALDPAVWTVLLVRIGAQDDAALRSFAAALGPAARVLAVDAADAALRDALAGELAVSRASLRSGQFPLTPTAAGTSLGLTPGFVSGYAVTRARPEAVVLARTDDGLLDAPPLAASWQLGSGTVLALPLPPRDASGVVSRTLGSLLPAANALELSARRVQRELRVRADGPRPATAELELQIDGQARRWPLPLGVSERTLPAPSTACELRVLDGDTTLARAHVAAPRESARAGSDPRRLGGLAARHGGRLLASLPTALPARKGASSRSLAWLLACLGVLALLVDVGWGALRTRRALRDLSDVTLA